MFNGQANPIFYLEKYILSKQNVNKTPFPAENSIISEQCNNTDLN